MNEQLKDSLLPLGAVCVAVLGLTALMFDVPAEAPRLVAKAPPAVRKRRLGDDTLAQAIRILDSARESTVTSRTVTVASATRDPVFESGPGSRPPALTAPAQPNPAPLADPREAPPIDPALTDAAARSTMDAMSALTAAIAATRNVRTEADLVNAESQIRIARERMQAACTNGGATFCRSAEQMRELGF